MLNIVDMEHGRGGTTRVRKADRIELLKYTEVLLVWHRIVEVETIRAIELQKWPGRKATIQRNRRYLLDARTPVILSLLAASGRELALSDLALNLTGGKSRGRELGSQKLHNAKEKLYRQLQVLEAYELLELRKKPYGRRERLVSSSPVLLRVFGEFLPYLHEIIGNWDSDGED